MGKKRKTRKQEEEKEEEDLLEYFSRLSYTVIYGRKFPRIKYEGTTNCEGCHTEPGHLHRVGCFFEWCPYCKGVAVNCLCDPDINNAERDNFIECLDTGL